MSKECDECGNEVSYHRRECTHFASRYYYECEECGKEWSSSKWS